MKKLFKSRKKGNVLIYATFAMISFGGFTSLAVDYGRVQLARTQMQNAADAAARYAVTGLYNRTDGLTMSRSMAAAAVAENWVDGTRAAIDQTRDVEYGTWNTSTKSFTPVANSDDANAVRITVRRTKTANGQIPLIFGKMIGIDGVDLMISSVATMDFGNGLGNGPGNGFGGSGTGSVASTSGKGVFEYYIPATSNPWLSGMPKGSIANNDNPHDNPDYAGTPYTDDGTRKTDAGDKGLNGTSYVAEDNWASWGDYAAKKGSPIKAGSIVIQGGLTLTFDGVNGGANNMSSSTLYDGDGNLDWIVNNYNGNENGMSDLYAPINSVVGIFLGDKQPNKVMTALPSQLDFTSPSSRDFTALSPQLRQPFFIGNGRRSNGDLQQFIAPSGATRLFLGTMDGYEWNNNIGGFEVRVVTAAKIVTVK